MAGEAGREVFGPAGGFRTAHITLMLDGRVLAQVIGQPLVDEIRLRTGTQF